LYSLSESDAAESLRSAYSLAKWKTMTITLTIRNFTGKAVPLDVDSNATVADVKAAIARTVTGLSKGAKQPALAFKGHELRDHKSLSHYDITDHAVLHLCECWFYSGRMHMSFT
jgi:hypothetical protein